MQSMRLLHSGTLSKKRAKRFRRFQKTQFRLMQKYARRLKFWAACVIEMGSSFLYPTTMTQKTMPRGVRRFISHEKARIRKTINDPTEQKRLIELLYPVQHRKPNVSKSKA